MKTNQNQEPAAPSYTKKIGNVRAAVWRNGSFYNITVGRQYRDGETYKESNSLNGAGDVACLREALRQVADWLSKEEDNLEEEYRQV